MRILHVLLYYPPAKGQAASCAHRLVQHTGNIDEKRDVRVLASNLQNNRSPLNPDLLLDDPMNIQRLHHIHLPLTIYPRLQALYYYITHHQPHIIHPYDINSPVTATAAKYPRHKNIDYILHQCATKTPSIIKSFLFIQASCVIFHTKKEKELLRGLIPSDIPSFLFSPMDFLRQGSVIQEIVNFYSNTIENKKRLG
jgi:hypothetical protein